MARTIDYVILSVATIIVVYVLYRMISKSMESKKTINPPFNNIPNSSQNNQLASVEQTTQSISIKNSVFPLSEDNALRNFCIKSSFNSACTGSYMNLDMIKYVLKRGCRFLDFQVFIKDNTPIVAYSREDYENAFTSSSPALSLAAVFSVINSNAFNQHSPNPNDPLFIQIKILSSLPTADSLIAESIAASFQENLYKDPNTGHAVKINLNVQMNQLKGKVVIFCDKPHSSSPSPSPSTSSSPTIMKLSDYVNLFTGTVNSRVYTEQQLTYQPINPPDPYVYNLHIVLPSLGLFYGVNNSDANYLIKNYGAQIIAQAFYVNDSNLNNYETMFNKYQSAFVPISSLLSDS